MNYKSVYFRVIRGEFLIFFTTDCTEITDIFTDFIPVDIQRCSGP